ncbi:dolichol phosphate-mannose biosynthesis regulatory protein [Plakobranchus ocellatus]|uniref:Dolichol phosphate-mannose biosynthesis regulatory protein n=1 Tax=Plakobranchus ocellatus TaxID=259542 RepID=A0AAV3Y915_9GAST|nr:dolichol phosphate-mannose biosynthesis regulatory protein [Plakobranchus ocellatus]
MAARLDQAVGWGLVSLAAFVFTYYTIWVIVLPFVDADQPIHKFFLPRFYAIAGPLVAGVVALTLIGTFIMYVSMSKKHRNLLVGVDGTVANDSALGSAGTFLLRVQVLPSVPWPDKGPESLRSPCCGLALYKKSNQS